MIPSPGFVGLTQRSEVLVPSTPEQLGQLAYDTYGHQRGWTVVGGGAMPAWADQEPELRAAWTAAATRVALRTLDEQDLLCPRRTENPGPWRYPDHDTWTDRAGHSSLGPSCSYCGSLHPDRFLELVQEGWVVGPTDKGYKAYLTPPLTDDELAEQKTRWLEHDAVARTVRELGERDGKTPAQIAADLDREWNSFPHGASGPRGKFYFQHLSVPQRHEFIELYNGGRMKLGDPGGFYVMPFFARTLPLNPDKPADGVTT